MTQRLFDNALSDDLARNEGRADDAARKTLLKSALSGIVALIVEGLKRDGFVRLHHFGTFRLKPVAARRGRNPQTGEPLLIPAHRRVVFTPAKALQECVEPVPPRTVVLETVTAVETPPAQPAMQPAVEMPPVTAQAPEPEPTESRRPWYGIAAAVVLAALLLTLLPGQQAPESPPVAVTPVSSVVETKLPGPTSTPSETVEIAKRVAPSTPETPAPETVAMIEAPTPIPAPEAPPETTAPVALATPVPPTLATTLIEPVALEKPAPPTVSSQPDAVEPSAATSDASPEASNAEAMTPATPESFFTERRYTVAEGDSLWRLSRRHYEEPILWPHIYRVNQPGVVDPDRIYRGDQLTLPTLYGPPTQLTDEDRAHIAEGYYAVYRYYESQGHPEAIYALIGARWFDRAVYEKYSPQINRQRLRIMELSPIYGDSVPQLLASVFQVNR